MAGNAFIGPQPSDFVWGSDETVYFKWNPDNNLIDKYYSYSINENKIERLMFDQGIIHPLNGLLEDDDENNAYFKFATSVYRKNKKGTTAIYSTQENYEVVRISNEKMIIRQAQNLFALSFSNGSFIQLTNFNEGKNPTATTENDTFLEQQQEELFEIIRSSNAKKAAKKEYREQINPTRLNPFYLNKWVLESVEISEDLERLAFIKSKYPKNTTTTYIDYITADGKAKAKQARAKVGTANPQHELFTWNLKKNTYVQVDFSALSDLHRVPLFYEIYPEKKIENYTKDLIYHLHGMNALGDKCLVEIKSYDNKDRWIGYVDMNSSEFVELNHQHDEKWIGGPGITGWNMVPGTVGWIGDDCFYFQSEESGYSHLYMCHTDTKKTSALTKGKFEIHNAELSQDKSQFYITANKNHPGNREFYTLNIEDKTLTPVLTKDGNHDVKVSPNEKWLLVRYSFKNKPWELYLAPNKPNTELKKITDSQSEKFRSYNWREPEVITFNASDGQPVHARIYEPTADKKNGAAVLFVHGAGYLQNAHNWWSGYYREYMFNNLLCDLGFTILDVDYRASKGYGRDFRTDIYRHMGGKDLSDHVDARKHLITNYGIDENRIGIYGGSYGGFISIMALLTEPGKFECAAAVRSVTDWAHYNHPYTSNILNTPSEDPVAFEQSSPIYFAHNLEDRLLMLHGMVDDNVQYQDVVRLSQRFIELGKKDWDLVGYPIEPHGFKETSSWVDEYGRILKLFQEELLPRN